MGGSLGNSLFKGKLRFLHIDMIGLVSVPIRDFSYIWPSKRFHFEHLEIKFFTPF